MIAQRFGMAVLVAATLFCLLTAWVSAMAPGAFAERLGLAIANAGGMNEIRAQYAGFFTAAALVCAASLGGMLPRPAAFILLAAIFGGLIAGRLVSLALNGGVAGYSPTILSLYVIDSVGLALALTALALDRAR
jgi:hypothetical protein